MSSRNRRTGNVLLPPAELRRAHRRLLPPGQALALDVLFGLRAGVQEMDNLLSLWLSQEGLTPGRFQVLAVLWAAEEPVPQREVVNLLRVTRATVSGLVETLCREGHVNAVPDTEDARQVLVSLTVAGRVTVERIVRETAERLRHAFTALSDAELHTLVDLLQRTSLSIRA